MSEFDSPTLLPLPEDDDTLIRRSDLPRYLPVASQTLARWATEGQGPRFLKLGRRLVAYKVGDLREWLESQTKSNTIETCLPLKKWE
jgi:predicted DNA-binding transcriptional regulator AlpA